MFGTFYFAQPYFAQGQETIVPTEHGSSNGDYVDYNNHKKAKERIKRQNELIVIIAKTYMKCQ